MTSPKAIAYPEPLKVLKETEGVGRGPKALITGISGQDGSYLAEQLLEKGYSVYGLVRRSANQNLSRISHLLDRVTILDADLTDSIALNRVLMWKWDYIYNLAAQSFVGTSFDNPESTMNVNCGGVVRILDGIKNFSPKTRFYQASSSEMFGKVKETPQTEETPFHPRSPYGISKCAAYWFTRHYREAYGIFAVNGILFNHGSERRGEEFVTRKVTRAAAAIKLGLQKELLLGNLDAVRDWGYAPDYTRAMILMMEAEEPDDYVVATGKTHTIRDLCEVAFGAVGLDWRDYVKQDPAFIRPCEVDLLCGDSTKIRRVLGWEPKTDFSTMIKKMVENDMSELRSQV